MENKIICENPTVILNPRLKFYLHMCDRIYIHDHCVYVGDKLTCVDLSKLSPKCNNITSENCDDCYIVNTATAQAFPLYIVVPCGKCKVCRYKKYKEFCARCEAETSVHDTVPLFVTLTYNPQFLPEEGLCKRDLQLFIKRLRARLEYYQYDSEIRYTACGEYGKNTHRAHYHLIIWGFPTDKFVTSNGINYAMINRFIIRCWSRFVLDSFGFKIPLLKKDGSKYRYPSGKIVYKTQEIGYTMTFPLVKSGCKYVAKYMLKDCVVPYGKNPTFMVSSIRGGGIGSKFIDSQKEEFYNNLDITFFPILDKMTNKITNMPIGNYVKGRLLPPPSRSLGQKLYQKCKAFFYLLEEYNEWFYTVVFFAHGADKYKNHPDFGSVFVFDLYQKHYDDLVHPAKLREESYRDVIKDLISLIPHNDYYTESLTPCDIVLKRMTYGDMIQKVLDMHKDLDKLAAEIRIYGESFKFCHEVMKLKTKRQNIFYDKNLEASNDNLDAFIERIVENFDRDQTRIDTNQKL